MHQPPPSQDQVAPLAMAVAPDSSFTKPSQKTQLNCRHHRLLLCFGIFGVVITAIFIVLLTIGLTVYKVKEPIMTMNSISLENLTSSSTGSASINMSVIADVSVKNPNAASYRYGSSMTSIYYYELLVGQAEAPPGVARARNTVRLNVTVDLMVSQLANDARFIQDLVTGDVRFNTSTRVGGKVKVFGMVPHHVDVMMNCSLTVDVSNVSMRNQTCWQRVWL